MVCEPLVLGFDTSAAHCAAALLSGDRILARTSEDMGRGQAERLMPLLEELLAGQGKGWRDLARIGVGVGPGNFTGIRISVSAARGLALGLGIPTVGVTGFAALRRAAGTDCAAIPAPRDTAYMQQGAGDPVILPRGEVPSGAAWPGDPAEMAVAIAQLAARAAEDSPPPAPLYIRPADAAPARDAPPVLLDDA